MNRHTSACDCCAGVYVARPCWDYYARTHSFQGTAGAAEVTTFTGASADSTNPPSGQPAFLKLHGAGGSGPQTLGAGSYIFGGGGALGDAQIVLPATATVNVGRAGPSTSTAASHLFGGGARGGAGLSYGGGRTLVATATHTYIAGGGGGGGSVDMVTTYGTGAAQGGAAGITTSEPTPAFPPAGQPASGSAGGAGGSTGGTAGAAGAVLTGANGGVGYRSAGGGGGGYAGGGGGGEADDGVGGPGGGGNSNNIAGWPAGDWQYQYDAYSGSGDGEHQSAAASDGTAEWIWKRCECECTTPGLPPELWLCLTDGQYKMLLAAAGGMDARPDPTVCTSSTGYHYLTFWYQGFPYSVRHNAASGAPETAGARACDRKAVTVDITLGFWTLIEDWCCVQWAAEPYDTLSCSPCWAPETIYLCDATRAAAGIPACLAEVGGSCHLIEYQGLRYSLQQPTASDYNCLGDHVPVTGVTYLPGSVCTPADQTPSSYLLEGTCADLCLFTYTCGPGCPLVEVVTVGTSVGFDVELTRVPDSCDWRARVNMPGGGDTGSIVATVVPQDPEPGGCVTSSIELTRAEFTLAISEVRPGECVATLTGGMWFAVVLECAVEFTCEATSGPATATLSLSGTSNPHDEISGWTETTCPSATCPDFCCTWTIT